MHPGTTRGPRRFRPIHPLIGPALFLLDETTRRLTVKGAATGEPQLTAADPPTPGAGL